MFRILSLYRFTSFPEPAALRAPLEAVCAAHGVRGSLLLAPEGINGTVAGTPQGVAAVLERIRALPGCDRLSMREDTAHEMPFGRMKVRLKRQIVTLGRNVDATRPGTYVEPADWNALLDDPATVAIDVRNAFEVDIGSFEGARDPGTASFGDFPGWFEANAPQLAGRRIAMFCTGGIRCEKATALASATGAEVYHLKGGILAYLERVAPERSRWRGECFVFDGRVSVGHGLRPGTHVLCHGCRRPVSTADRMRPEWEDGVRCHRCAPEIPDGRRARYRERARQVRLAAARGDAHLGPRPPAPGSD